MSELKLEKQWVLREVDGGPAFDSPERFKVFGQDIEIPTRKYRVDCPSCAYDTDSRTKIVEHIESEHNIADFTDYLLTH